MKMRTWISDLFQSDLESHLKYVIGLIVVLAVAAEVLGGIGPSMKTFVITTLINLMIVVGLYILIGNSGIVSFGQISFMGIGAYMAGLLTVEVSRKEFLLPDLPGWLSTLHLGTPLATLVVAILCGLVALVLAIPLMRLSGLAASIATLALLIISNVVITQSTAITGGNQTFIGIPVNTTIEVALAGAVVAIVAAAWFGRTGIGLRLKASRDDEAAARAVGISITWERVLAFALSGAIIGVAGSLNAHFLGSISPTNFYLEITFITLAMLVVGGLYSFWGGVVGAIVISVLKEVLGRLENGEGLGPLHVILPDGITAIILAITVIVVMIFRPAGLVGSRDKLLEKESVVAEE